MANDDAEKVSGASALDKGVGVLERTWDAHWALRFTCLVLFLDMAMMFRVRRGLWQWSEADRALLTDVGWIAVTVVAFSLAVAIVVPGVQAVARIATIFVPGWLHRFFFPAAYRDYERGFGEVPASKFLDLALKEKDAFLYGIYVAHQMQRKLARQALEQAGQLTAATFLFASADWALPYWIPSSASLMGVLIKSLGDSAQVFILFALLGTWAIVSRAWFGVSPPNYIYYPLLDRELRDKEREDRLGPK